MRQSHVLIHNLQNVKHCNHDQQKYYTEITETLPVFFKSMIVMGEKCDFVTNVSNIFAKINDFLSKMTNVPYYESNKYLYWKSLENLMHVLIHFL